MSHKRIVFFAVALFVAVLPVGASLAADPTDAAGVLTSVASGITTIPALALLGVFLVVMYGMKYIIKTIKTGTR